MKILSLHLQIIIMGSSAMGSSESDNLSSSSLSPLGLLLNSTPTIKKFLSSAVLSASLPNALSASASQYAEADVVPYKLVRDVWAEMQSDSRPRLRLLLAGSTFAFQRPKPRKKSAELEARLLKLQDMADRKAYDELVKDVTQNKQEQEYFSSYKNQLGFGLHVIVTMFTCYLVGYAVFRSQFGNNPVLHAAGGVLGLVIGMLVETLLFIINTSKSEERTSSSKNSSGRRGLLSSKED